MLVSRLNHQVLLTVKGRRKKRRKTAAMRACVGRRGGGRGRVPRAAGASPGRHGRAAEISASLGLFVPAGVRRTDGGARARQPT